MSLDYTVYNATTGRVERSGYCQPTRLFAMRARLAEGLQIAGGIAGDPDKHKVQVEKDGTCRLVELTPEEKAVRVARKEQIRTKLEFVTVDQVISAMSQTGRQLTRADFQAELSPSAVEKPTEGRPPA